MKLWIDWVAIRFSAAQHVVTNGVSANFILQVKMNVCKLDQTDRLLSVRFANHTFIKLIYEIVILQVIWFTGQNLFDVAIRGHG